MRRSSTAASPVTETAKVSKRTPTFKGQLEKLPESVQRAATNLFKVFRQNPADPILETESLNDNKRGRHRRDSFSVRVGLRYRAIYVVDNGERGDEPKQYCWYWIGSHQDYNKFIGSRRG